MGKIQYHEEFLHDHTSILDQDPISAIIGTAIGKCQTCDDRCPLQGCLHLRLSGLVCHLVLAAPLDPLL